MINVDAKGKVCQVAEQGILGLFLVDIRVLSEINF